MAPCKDSSTTLTVRLLEIANLSITRDLHQTGYAPEKIPYGISRYLNESRRLYKVMETQLQKTPFLVGEKCTIADISCWGWVAAAGKLDPYTLPGVPHIAQ